MRAPPPWARCPASTAPASTRRVVGADGFVVAGSFDAANDVIFA
jgi:hypothetical protein